jgi:hypothetical protein
LSNSVIDGATALTWKVPESESDQGLGAGRARRLYNESTNRRWQMAARTAQTMSASALSQQALPTIPAGQTTVLTVDELNRIKTTLLHADAKTNGSQILSEVGSLIIYSHQISMICLQS